MIRILLAALLPLPALAETSGLRAPGEIGGTGEARSVALFEEMMVVIGHPRCMNCHPVGDSPLQDAMEPHRPWAVRGPDGHGAAGMRCETCHGAPGDFDEVKPAWDAGLTPDRRARFVATGHRTLTDADRIGRAATPAAPTVEELTDAVAGVLTEHAGRLGVPAGGRVSVGVTLGRATGERDLRPLTDEMRGTLAEASAASELLRTRGDFRGAFQELSRAFSDSVAATDRSWAEAPRAWSAAGAESFSADAAARFYAARYRPEVLAELAALSRELAAVQEAAEAAGKALTDLGSPEEYRGFADAYEMHRVAVRSVRLSLSVRPGDAAVVVRRIAPGASRN